MVAVNQRIPNFLGGVSQQPDFIKFPGQLRTCNNALPDVTFGLVKRPAGEYVGILANAEANGEWFEIIRDDESKYVVQITDTPEIFVWDIETGAQQTVNVAAGVNLNYLTRDPGSTKPFSLLTINDYTFIANPDKTVGTDRTTPSFQDNYGFVTVDAITYNSEYLVSIGNSNLISTTKYKAATLSVVKWGTSSPSFVVAGDEGSKVGQTTFISTSSGSNGVKCTVTVNGNIIATHTSGNNPAYDTSYHSQVTLLEGGEDVTNGASFNVTVAGETYTVTITDVYSYESYADNNAAIYKTPENSQKGLLTIDSVLGALADAIESKYSGVDVTPTGNGLFIDGNTVSIPSITVRGGAAGDSLYGFIDSVQNVSKLPTYCKHGYIVKVSNTENEGTDDYYLKFNADNDDIGSGVWEETVKPGIVGGFDYATMPHALINNLDGTFTFTTLDPTNATTVGFPNNYWKDREVGDELTNPIPTFEGLNISSLFFYRNRLGIVADEQVVLSQPAGYFNFFINSALSTSDADPIDMAASDVKPAIINHALPIQKGVMLFSENAQFMLFTDSEQFGPKTAQLKKVSSYECSKFIRPVDLGTTLMFVSNSSSFAKAFELAVRTDIEAPQVLEQTRVVPEFVPKDINEVAISTQDGIVSFSKAGTSDIYHYKYFNSGDKREQSAWYTWQVQGNLYHSFYTSGNYFTVTEQGNQFILSRHELVGDADTTGSYVVGEGTPSDPLTTSRRFEALLDNMVIPTAGNKTLSGEDTVITLPYTIQNNGDDLIMVVLSGDDAGYVTGPSSVNGANATFANVDATNVNVAVGYKYTMEFQLPSYYYQVERGQNDINADLRINRFNFELGVSGPLEFHLEAPQADDYVQYESGVVADLNNYSSIPTSLYKSVKVPVYKKNTKYTMTVKAPDPFTTTIVSASWDGRYDNRRHVRR